MIVEGSLVHMHVDNLSDVCVPVRALRFSRSAVPPFDLTKSEGPQSIPYDQH